jgi:hypothetical protein
MEAKTTQALQWIVATLNKHKVPYRVGGGMAAHIYGSTRPVQDIDISLPGKYFDKIIPDVKEFIISEPKHYSDEKWDCNTLVLNYHGQEIDISDIETLRMSNKDETEWLQTKDRYRAFPNLIKNIEGIGVSFIDPRDLLAYKKELNGEHQLMDIQAIENYIQRWVRS